MNAKPIIPWIGGKRRLARQILAVMPEHHTYVEPFCGGAAVFFHKQPSAVEVLNDINSDLVTLYRVVKHHLEEFVRHFKWSLVSREDFLLARQVDPETLTDIQRAARFYYLQRLAFGGKVSGRTFGTSVVSPPRLNLLRIEEELSAAHLRLARVTVEHLPWAELIDRYDRPDTLFYLDPPYWQTEGYGVPFGWEQYEAMVELLSRIKGKAIVSINDHPEIRTLFDGFAMDRLALRYTVGTGQSRSEERGELLIRSW